MHSDLSGWPRSWRTQKFWTEKEEDGKTSRKKNTKQQFMYFMILCGRVVINLSREHWCLLNQSANVICRAPRNWNSVKHTGHWHRNPQKQRQNQHKFIANFQQFQTSTSNCSHHSLNQAPLGLSPTWCEQRTEPFGNLKCSNARMATRQHVTLNALT